MHDIKLSEIALGKALEILSSQPQSQRHLRLYLDGKGCDGFYYGVTFDAIGESDLQSYQKDLSVIIDTETFRFCRGSLIEWVDDDRGTGFLVQNPNHRKFRGKFYKRASWQKALSEQKKS